MIAIYIRESSDSQEGNWSHKRQHTCAQAWLKQIGRDDYKIYEDIKSGKAGVTRKNWEQLKKDIQSDKIDTLHFFKYYRLGRDAEENEKVKKLLKLHKVKFYEEESHSYLDLNNSGVDLVTTIIGKQAEIDNETRRKTIIDGLTEQYDTGHRRYTGKLYGYYATTTIGKSKKGQEKIIRKWNKEPNEEIIIKRIYELALSGKYGLHAISRLINNAGFRTRYDKSWNYNGIRNVLTKPQYAALTYDSQHNLIQSKDYEPIVTEKEYYSMKEKYPVYFTEKKKGRPDEQLSSGLLNCEFCGSKYRHFPSDNIYEKKDGTVTVKHKLQYYHKNTVECENQKLYIKKVVDGITIQIFLDAIEAKQNILRNLNKECDTDEISDSIGNLKHRRDKVASEMENLKKAIIAGLNIDSVIKDINQRQATIDEYNNAINDKTRQYEEKRKNLESEIGFVQTLEVAKIAAAKSDKERNTLIKRIIRVIRISKHNFQGEYVDGSFSKVYDYAKESLKRKLFAKNLNLSIVPPQEGISYDFLIEESILRKIVI